MRGFCLTEGCANLWCSQHETRPVLQGVMRDPDNPRRKMDTLTRHPGCPTAKMLNSHSIMSAYVSHSNCMLEPICNTICIKRTTFHTCHLWYLWKVWLVSQQAKSFTWKNLSQKTDNVWNMFRRCSKSLSDLVFVVINNVKRTCRQQCGF